MSQISKIILDMEYNELMLIKKDLNEGSIEKLINSRIEALTKEGGTICPVCNSDIADGQDGAFTLFFGPKGFRKKASFCATDCLEYFVQKLKRINDKKLKRGCE